MENVVFHTRTGVVSCDLDVGRALLDLDDSQYFRLNSTAAAVWEWLEAAPAGLNELATRMQATFDVDDARCRADLETVLSSLLEAGLIEQRSHGAA